VRINDKEECGFKQVSSSFAVNYVADKIVNDELLRTDIKTEQECISGAVGPTALLNPNIGAAVDEALNPAIYNRGIVRVCATDNPGLTTDPARFVKVGVCGVERLGCWLDKNSVKNTVDASNTGLKDKTLSEIEQIQKDNFDKDNRYTVSSDLQGKIKNINLDNADKNKLQGYLTDLGLLKPFWNYDIAEVTLMKARVLDRLFRISTTEFKITGTSATPAQSLTNNKESSIPSTEKRVLSFGEKEYSSSTRSYIFFNGVITKLYILGEYLYFENSRVGYIEERRIIFADGSKRELIEIEIGKGSYNLINNNVVTIDDLNKFFDLNSIR
jgi:hypothetical protein